MPDGKPVLDGAEPIAVVSDLLPWGLEAAADGSEAEAAVSTPPTRRGLHAALCAPLHKRGGVWLGWPGAGVRAVPARGAPFRLESVDLEDLDARGWHCGYSAGSLWPLLHSMPGRLDFCRAHWRAYDEVNARFAARAAGLADETGTFWFHGHHLLGAPRHLRRLCPEARIHFFLHTPFPSRDVFESLPYGEALLRSLTACDLVGFQTHAYARNFLDCAGLLEEVEVLSEWRTLVTERRETRVGVFPMGIDWDRYESAARAAPAPVPGGERILLAVDRLAPTSGVPERLRAYDLLLERHPRWRGKVSLLQVLAPSAEGAEADTALKREVDELVGRVNGRFGSAGWLPVRYMTKELPHETLCGLYRQADLALATPLREGMSLVAKEFVACQIEQAGVLVLSRTAGAAESMREACRVNPHDAEGMADALDEALAMPAAERRRRMAALRARERAMDADAWAERFLSAAARRPSHGRPPVFVAEALPEGPEAAE